MLEVTMKRIIVPLIISFMAFGAEAVNALEKAPLGKGNIAFKVDYIQFTDDIFDEFDADDGYYLAIEGYGKISGSLYLGGEVGYGKAEGELRAPGMKFDIDIYYIPIELNMKYVAPITPQFSIDMGAGISANYFEGDVSDVSFALLDEDEWLFGAQFFIDANITFNRLFIGINTKYQITENVNDDTFDLYNWRIGGQVGIMF
jgi:hypothetical protein